MMIENPKDNTNDNRSLTPIHKDNDNSFISNYIFNIFILKNKIIIII